MFDNLTKEMEMKKGMLLATLLFVPLIAGAYVYAPQPKVHVPAAPITVNITATAAQVLPANGNRTGLECTNTGSNTVFLYQGGAAASAVAGYGTAIPPSTMWYSDDYNFQQGLISAVAASGVTSTLSCQEYN